MTTTRDTSISDQDVRLDDAEIVGCTLTNCRLLYGGGGHPVLRETSISGGQLVFDGAARNTIDFMQTFYRHGAAEVIDQTFAAVRGVPQQVFRFFDEEDYAEQFLRGEIYMSTISACRKAEDAERSDPDEASMLYDSGDLTIKDSDMDPDAAHVFASMDIHVDPGVRVTNMKIENGRSERRLTDAWVICTTLNHAPDKMSGFGKFCIRINRPDYFFHLVSGALADERTIVEGQYGAVVYSDRRYRGRGNSPGPILFVKPPDKYVHQAEFRFGWLPPLPGEQLTPFKLSQKVSPFLFEKLW